MYERVKGWKFLIIGALTLGIYQIVIWCRMTNNMNDMARKVGERPICGYIASILLSIITCGIYGIIWIFKFFGLAARLNKKANAGVAPSNPFLMFLMSCIPYYSYFWMANMHNELADAYERI